jgi:VanZ family protein
VLNVLPINGKESALNNNYILHIRWDYLGHFVAYGLLGVLGFLYAKAKQINPAIAIFLLLSLAVSAELLQKLISWRSFNINDLAANLMGTVMGTLGIMILISFNRKYRWVR